MNKYTFRVHGEQWERVSRATACKLWNAGEELIICPAKMRPGGPWGIGAMVSPENATSFHDMVNSFSYYNCTPETGKYPAFYKRV